MAFPTIPTVAAGRVVTGTQTGTSQTRTFPSLSGLTKNSGDLLIAIVLAYQSSASAGAVFSSWGASFTEFLDVGGASNGAIGAAYKVSNGGETGTFTVTQAATVTGDACFILLSIPNGSQLLAPVGGTIVNNTAAAADIASLNPATWGTLDTLWIAVALAQETSTTSTFTGVGAAPSNYGNYADTGISQDAVGGVEGAVAFRQLNAASEDPGGFATIDVTNARNSSVLIAVAPHPQTVTLVEATGLTQLQSLVHNRVINPTVTEATSVTFANEIITLQPLPAETISSPQALNVDKLVTIGVASSATTAEAVSFEQTANYELADVDTATSVQALDADKSVTIVEATAATAAQALTVTKPIYKTLTEATSATSAEAVSYSQAGNFDLTLVTTTTSAQAVDADKKVTITAATSTVAANEITTLQPYPALTTTEAQTLSISLGGRRLTQATTTTSAQTLTVTKPIRVTLGVVTSTTAAQVLTPSSPAGEYNIAPATTTTVANEIIPLQPLPAATTVTAMPLTVVQGALSITPATTTTAAQAVTKSIGVRLPVDEQTPPLPYNSVSVGGVTTAMALSVTTGATTYNLTPATTATSAQALDKDKRLSISRTDTTAAAQSVTFTGPQDYTLGAADSTAAAVALVYVKTIYKTLTPATTTSAAQVLDIFNPAYSLTNATVSTSAAALALTKTIHVTLVDVGTNTEARFVTTGQSFIIEPVTSASTAVAFTYGKLNVPGTVGALSTGRITRYRVGRITREEVEV